MTEFFQQPVNGLSIGSIYALIASGYTVVHDITKLINFVYGDIHILGTYVGSIPIAQLHLGFFPTLLLVMVACGMLGVVIERIVCKPLRNATQIAALTTTIDVSYFLEYSTQKIMGPGAEAYPSILGDQALHMFGTQIQIQQIYVLAIIVILMLALQFTIRKTKIRRSMCAVSVDTGAAKLMGINADTTIFCTFVIGSALARVGGVLVDIYYNTVNPLMGVVPGIKTFVAAVLGGIGVTPGATFGGFFISIVETLVTAYGNSLCKDATVYAILILILIIRPAGLLGKNVKERAQAHETYLQ